MRDAIKRLEEAQITAQLGDAQRFARDEQYRKEIILRFLQAQQVEDAKEKAKRFEACYQQYLQAAQTQGNSQNGHHHSENSHLKVAEPIYLEEGIRHALVKMFVAAEKALNAIDAAEHLSKDEKVALKSAVKETTSADTIKRIVKKIEADAANPQTTATATPTQQPTPAPKPATSVREEVEREFIIHTRRQLPNHSDQRVRDLVASVPALEDLMFSVTMFASTVLVSRNPQMNSLFGLFGMFAERNAPLNGASKAAIMAEALRGQTGLGRSNY